MRPAEIRIGKITNDRKLTLTFTEAMDWPDNIVDLIKNVDSKIDGRRDLVDQKDKMLDIMMLSAEAEGVDSNLSDWSVEEITPNKI